jgi:uncharacterized protein
MVDIGGITAGHFCWVDLAATDATLAQDFYGQLLGWTASEEHANGGSFTRLRLSGEDVGSMYQLKRAHVDHGVQSHWTPYIRVDNVDDVARRVVALGGEVIVHPVAVSGIARIALIVDPVGAHLGLWESIDPLQENADG